MNIKGIMRIDDTVFWCELVDKTLLVYEETPDKPTIRKEIYTYKVKNWQDLKIVVKQEFKTRRLEYEDAKTFKVATVSGDPA